MEYRKKFTDLNWQNYLISEKGKPDHILYNISELIDNSLAARNGDESLEIVIKFSPSSKTIEYLDNGLGMHAIDWSEIDKPIADGSLNKAFLKHTSTDSTNGKNIYGAGLKIALGRLGKKYFIQSKKDGYNISHIDLDLNEIIDNNRGQEPVELIICEDNNSDSKLPIIENNNFNHGTYIKISNCWHDITNGRLLPNKENKNLNCLARLLEFRYAPLLKDGKITIKSSSETAKVNNYNQYTLLYPSVIDNAYSANETFSQIYSGDQQKIDYYIEKLVNDLELFFKSHRSACFLFENGNYQQIIEKIRNKLPLIFSLEWTASSINLKTTIKWKILPWKKSPTIQKYHYKELNGFSLLANGRYILAHYNFDDEWIYSNNISLPIYKKGDSSEFNGLQRLHFEINLTDAIANERKIIAVKENRIIEEEHKTTFAESERFSNFRNDLKTFIEKIRIEWKDIMQIFLTYDDINISNNEIKNDFSYTYGSKNTTFSSGTPITEVIKEIKKNL